MMNMLRVLKPQGMSSVEQLRLDAKTFRAVVNENIVLVNKAFRNQMVVPGFDAFCEQITEIYESVRDNCFVAHAESVVIPHASLLCAVQEEPRRRHLGRHPAAGLGLARQLGRLDLHRRRAEVRRREWHKGLVVISTHQQFAL